MFILILSVRFISGWTVEYFCLKPNCKGLIKLLSLKNLFILFYIDLSEKFSILGESETECWFAKSSLEFFLCTGITFGVFSIEGDTPEDKEILNI